MGKICKCNALDVNGVPVDFKGKHANGSGGI
jgi:hypothetical protein